MSLIGTTYDHEAVREALKTAGLPNNEPSQLADSFRLGWAAAMKAVRESDNG